MHTLIAAARIGMMLTNSHERGTQTDDAINRPSNNTCKLRFMQLTYDASMMMRQSSATLAARKRDESREERH
jgi:hypothetical protein